MLQWRDVCFQILAGFSSQICINSERSELFGLLTNGLIASSKGMVCFSLCLCHPTADRCPWSGAAAALYSPLRSIAQYHLLAVCCPSTRWEGALPPLVGWSHPPPSAPHDSVKCLTRVQGEGTSLL